MYTRIKLVIAALLVVVYTTASETPEALKLKKYQLENGLTVYLNHDATANSVMGMVVVKGGSKRDPHDATGIAHYFEHIMFKGSQKLGTTDYQKEKVYLDSIANQYEALGVSTDKEERAKIQLKINSLSLKAAEYAIPNEFDKLIKKMGGSDVNAFTSYDHIAYLNSFPASEMEKWLEVYSNRFEEPVFRLFQAELETVFEEKNMYADNMATPFFEALMKALFEGTPYGEQTILGTAEHLKNPSLQKMKAYYETYYVPNNMALILTGNFEEERTAQLIEEKFGDWLYKELPKHEPIELKAFEGRELSKHRLLPIRVGVLGYHTVPNNHPDFLKLELCSRLLYNYSYTGLLDQLSNDNKLMEASIETLAFDDVGAHLIVVLPKLVGQSLAKAEKLALAQLDSLKAGRFSDDLFSAVKLEMIKDNSENIEESKYRALSIREVFIYDTSWNDVVAFDDRVNQLTKADVIATAKKYYGDNYLAFYSRMGFPKKDKVKKPPYKAIKPENTEAHSDYYKQVNAIESAEVAPHFITEGKDFHKGNIYPNAEYYYVANPINDVFSLELKYRIGLVENQDVEIAASVLDYCGTDEMSYEAFRKELQNIGADFYVRSSDNALSVEITGIEQNLEATLKLMNQLLSNPVLVDKEKIKMVRSLKLDKKFSSKDVATKSDALNNYALYGSKSSYLLSANAKQIKAKSIEELTAIAKGALSRQVELHYVGAIGHEKMADIAQQHLVCLKELESNDQLFSRAIKETDEHVIYFLNDKKAVQTQVKITVKSGHNSKKDVVDSKLFNDYFCGDMSSIVFQEIREFRSLAYSARGRYVMPLNTDYKGYFKGRMTTQADKTIEALETYTGLLNDMPLYPDRIEDTKHSLKVSINNNRPAFRYLSSKVPYWKYYGDDMDPNTKMYAAYDKAEFKQIENFYKKYLKERKMIITLVGDKKRIDMDELKRFGKVIEVKKSQIFNF